MNKDKSRFLRLIDDLDDTLDINKIYITRMSLSLNVPQGYYMSHDVIIIRVITVVYITVLF